ncbi:hypothetical protein DPEC_G00234460 [Dallia pectoralis]|uniref:Uncharacterized protein n=1 Tax=Dallia pectoralis TaxID=75939 RepID=A0ACC2FXK5_DALPE|nr:hypothetical protein DPEC_G00234460 [Dallia pectoralis]
MEAGSFMDEYSKRVYQGVRVKHTVKDLLAEKRQKQTSVPRFNAGTSHSQPTFVQMPGSHMLPGYYSMRRPYLTDSDFSPSAKQYSSESYSSTLGGKALSYDHSTTYPAYIDSYYSPEFGDYRGATAFTTGGGPLFPTSSLPHLLPPLPGESSHLLLRDSWEPSDGDSVSQGEVLCSEGPVPTTVSSGLASTDPDSPSLYRLIPSRGGGSTLSLSGSQPYSLHPLEEVHYPSSSYAPSPSYPSSYTYMVSSGESSGVKVSPVSSEDPSSGAVPLSDASWVKDDGTSSWLPYEPRKAY